MATDKAQTLNNLRTKILTESLTNEGRNKYGLFSYPPAGVSGVHNYEFNKTKMIGTDGKPKTAPRGVFSGPGRSGKVESSYFGKSAYVTIGDKYVDPASRDRQYNNEKKKKIRHESEFKPASGTKSDPCKALWAHKPEFSTEKKNYRGPDGKVIIPNRNIITNPPKFGHGDTTVGHLLSKGYKHQADPYNRPQELQKKEAEEHRKKLQEAPFRTTSHGNQNFVSSRKTFGKDDKVLDPTKPKMRATLPKLHEAAFRPSHPAKVGYNKTISKFPEYKPDPIRMAVRQIEDPSKKKEPYIPNNTADYERPTPSISLNKQNLKNEMARISQSLV